MARDVHIGAVIDDRFVIVSALGDGGMGSVYLGRQLHIERDCAIKFLHADLAGDKQYLARFQREARILSELIHPNITRFFYYGVYGDKFPYFAMEYVQGQTLKDLLAADGHLSWRRSLLIARQIAEALAVSHAHGVVHRDLKPANVFLIDTPEQELIKVCDFGLARQLDSSGQELTGMGVLIGTVHYMSPEQCRGEQADERSDVYSLGCIMFEMLTGHPPYESDTAMGVIFAHAKSDVPKLEQELDGSQLPVGLNDLVAKCMAKQPAKRYRSMAAIAAEIDQILQADGATTDRITRLRPVLASSLRVLVKRLLQAAKVGLLLLVIVLPLVWLLRTQLVWLFASSIRQPPSADDACRLSGYGAACQDRNDPDLALAFYQASLKTYTACSTRLSLMENNCRLLMVPILKARGATAEAQLVTTSIAEALSDSLESPLYTMCDERQRSAYLYNVLGAIEAVPPLPKPSVMRSLRAAFQPFQRGVDGVRAMRYLDLLNTLADKSPGGRDTSVQGLVEAADVYCNGGDSIKAAAMIDQLVDRVAHGALAHEYMTENHVRVMDICMERLERFDELAALLEQLAGSSNRPLRRVGAYGRLGKLYIRLDQPDKAKDAFRRALAALSGTVLCPMDVLALYIKLAADSEPLHAPDIAARILAGANEVLKSPDLKNGTLVRLAIDACSCHCGSETGKEICRRAIQKLDGHDAVGLTSRKIFLTLLVDYLVNRRDVPVLQLYCTALADTVHHGAESYSAAERLNVSVLLARAYLLLGHEAAARELALRMPSLLARLPVNELMQRGCAAVSVGDLLLALGHRDLAEQQFNAAEQLLRMTSYSQETLRARLGRIETALRLGQVDKAESLADEIANDQAGHWSAGYNAMEYAGILVTRMELAAQRKNRPQVVVSRVLLSERWRNWPRPLLEVKAYACTGMARTAFVLGDYQAARDICGSVWALEKGVTNWPRASVAGCMVLYKCHDQARCLELLDQVDRNYGPALADNTALCRLYLQLKASRQTRTRSAIWADVRTTLSRLRRTRGLSEMGMLPWLASLNLVAAQERQSLLDLRPLVISTLYFSREQRLIDAYDVLNCPQLDQLH